MLSRFTQRSAQDKTSLSGGYHKKIKNISLSTQIPSPDNQASKLKYFCPQIKPNAHSFYCLNKNTQKNKAQMTPLCNERFFIF
jgi:hypothetical protein